MSVGGHVTARRKTVRSDGRFLENQVGSGETVDLGADGTMNLPPGATAC